MPPEITTSLPADPQPAVDERTTLVEFLEYQRAVFIRKVEGLDEQQARRPACPPSDLTPLGLVRHMAQVELGWFRRGLGEELDDLFDDSHDPDVDLHPGPDDTLAEAITMWHAQVEAARANVARADLDELLVDGREPRKSVRWTVVHMIEEYARHCGHLDLLAEAIDGRTGD